MMPSINNPRTTLHALAPIGQGTAEAESLTSYFCRLAYSHGITARNLAAWVLEHYEQPIPDDYRWFRRAFAGMSEESEQWAAWLAALTGIESLDTLTLVPWRHLISNASLTSKSDRWCPHCLSEDRASNQPPYLRLYWDVTVVTACAHHKVELTATCPHCGQSKVRHRASTVVPGYCTSCGGFLGESKTKPATPSALWHARQVAQMLAHRPTVSADQVNTLLETVIERMADSRVSTFAQMLGLSKSGVWHWLNKGGLPTLPAWLAVSLHGGIGLDQLFSGDLADWALPTEPAQIPIRLSESPRKGIKGRILDWDVIRAQLHAILDEPVPTSLGQACQRVSVDQKQIYQHANTEARTIVDRYRQYQSASRQDRETRLDEQVTALLQERQDAGFEGLSAREVRQMLDGDLKSVRHSFRYIGAAIAANDQ